MNVTPTRAKKAGRNRIQSARLDPRDLTHVLRLPGSGDFQTTLSPTTVGCFTTILLASPVSVRRTVPWGSAARLFVPLTSFHLVHPCVEKTASNTVATGKRKSVRGSDLPHLQSPGDATLRKR